MNPSITTYNKIAALEDIKIEPFDVNKRYTKPHRHNKYLELVYFTKGTGYHHMDLNSYEIKPPVVFLVRKEEVHHWEITTEPKGYVIIIKEGFLQKTLDKHINTQLLKLGENQKIDLLKKDKTIAALFKLLTKEVKENTTPIEVIEGMLKSLFAKILTYSQAPKNKELITEDKVTLFVSMLGETLMNNVSYYADQLNVSSQNLNQLCKKKQGKTASQIIAFYMVQEIKRLLIYTDKSVGEIAYDLHFKDVSHFVKYFKRHTGMTPLQFKNTSI
ncbi:AraC-like DNA-binding protein [Wenyingzhuangia heitensis]|uniref:AraC-like DNA-binding protein n=1 Tax=Wenyingzhuangia heitensis TaxID=1487859 RepID=A0ABX0U9V7_9FLAO|nr:helix-turn-helix transcriptional regulator [Wenyingzhuangia heitensis]NIJ45619.1 AraC-like DNA-binding protein [Wenyingzhuangia heitensis]